MLAELDYDNAEKCFYTRGDELISQERDGKKSYYVYDGHGSVRALADENGKVTDTYAYDAFGNLLKSKGNTENCYRYCGEQFDETTGLYYLRARYMDTSTGRFISQDSYSGSISEPVSLHKYLYANANPVTYSDPSGYMSMAGLAVRGAVIGALSGLIVPNAVSIIRNLVTTGEFKSDLSPMQNLANILNGVIFGALFGICDATFIAYGIIAGVAVSINFGLSYKYFIDGQNAAANGQWDIAICSWLFCLFYLIAGFTTISLASNLDYSNTNQNNSNTNSNDSNANDRVNNDKIVESANKPHKGGETIAGHALQKHAGRHPEIWGRIKGGSDEINETALKHLNEILDAEGEFTVNQAPNGAYFLEKTLPDGRGVRINMDGTFKGFIDQ